MEESKHDPKPALSQNKLYFIFGLLVGIAVISTLGFIALLSIAYNSGRGSEKNLAYSNVNFNTNQNINTTVATPPAAPTQAVADASKLSPVTLDDHVLGNYNAPVTMIEFADFQCPFCLQFESTLNKVLADYQGKVRLVYRHFPLAFHAEAEKAAEASECAAEQGKFWEMHDKIFEANQSQTMSVDQWKKIARSLGLKTTQFNNCLDSGKYANKIASEENEGQAAGVQGTPTIFINGELVSGALPYDSIKSVIDSKLKQ